MLTNSLKIIRRFTVLNCIGIDVSKATINVHISKNGQDLVLDNSPKSFKLLYSKFIKKRLRILYLFTSQQVVIQKHLESIVLYKKLSVSS